MMETRQPASPGPSGIKHALDNTGSDTSPKRIKYTLNNESTYAASGVKRALHGTIYQLQLLMLFVQRGINKYGNFALATEMDKAEKFDDVVFKYRESNNAEKFTWRFLQAKHKQNQDKDKITVNDLATSKDEDFSLQKYFVSFYKIQNDKEFKKNYLKDFTICTNTNFDFELKDGERKDTKNKKIKWEQFFTNPKDLEEDKILYFEEEKGEEVRFKKDAQIRKDLVEEIKSALEKNIKEIGSKASELKRTKLDKLLDLRAAYDNFDTKIDDQSETYINEFLEKFRFVLNYPDVDELNSLIGEEVGEDFKLLNADLITNSFQKMMLDWLKEKAGKYLSEKDAEGFFSSIKEQINILMTSGLSKAYPEKLRGYGICFENNLESLNDFLSNDNKILHLSTQSTRLSAIKVLQTLESNTFKEKYDYLKAQDGYIFMRLRTLLRQETQRYVLKAFSPNQNSLSKKTYNLLVIEYQSKTKLDKREPLWNKLSNQLKKKQLEKIILIAQDGDLIIKKFNNFQEYIYHEKNDLISFKDLNKDSQDKVLERPVNFQGRDISLNRLIDKDSASEIIDQASLSRLLEENIQIGDTRAFSSIGYVGGEEGYYISRKFHSQRIKTDILKEKDFSKPKALAQKVAIIANDPGVGKSTVLTSIALRMKKESSALWVVRVNLNDYTVKGKENSLEKIDFDENEAEKAIDFVSKMAISGDSKDAKIQLQRKFFKAGLKKCKNSNGEEFKNPKIVILFDGFDEISPSYKAKTTNLIKALKGSEVIQLWVATRVHEKDHLEEELESPVYILNPLTESNQIDFLSKFWKWNLKFYKDPYSQEVCDRTYEDILEHLKEIKLPNVFFTGQLTEDISNILNDYPLEAVDKLVELREVIDKLNFTSYTKGLLDQWNKSISDGDKKFTLIPLHLRMLTEVVFKKQFQLPKILGLFDIYYDFVNLKFNIFYDEKGKVGSTVASDDVREDHVQNLCEKYQELALKLFYPELSQIEFKAKDKIKLARSGILNLKEDQLEFIHRSFAEYFFSEYLVRNLENEQVQKLLLEKFLQEHDYGLIREFFNGHLEKNPTSINLTEAVKTLMAKELERPKKTLYLVAREGHCGIYEFISKSISNNLHEKLMINTDFTGFTFVHYAIVGNHNKFVKKLLCDNFKRNPNNLINKILKLDCLQGTPLTVAVDQGYTEIVKTLLNFIKEKFTDGDYFDILKVVKIDKDSSTILHKAAKRGYSEIFKEILDSIKNYPAILKELVLKTDYYGATTLLKAINMNKKFPNVEDKYRREIVLTLLESIENNLRFLEVEVTEVLDDLAILSVFGDARYETQEEIIIEELRKYMDTKSKTYTKLTFIKDYLGKIKEKCNFLSEAICDGDKNEVQKILDGSQPYIKELILTTSLHKAADKNQTEIIEKLLESVKNYPRILEELVLKVDTFENKTALHRAASLGNNETVLLLLNFVNDHLGKECLKKMLLKIEKYYRPAIYAAHHSKCHQTVKVFLEFIVKHLPEFLHKQVEQILGMRNTLKWAEDKGYLYLKQRLLDQIGSQEQRKIDLFNAAQDGDSTALKNLLDGVKNDGQGIEEFLQAHNEKGTLLDLATGDATYTLLNWMKENSPGSILETLELANNRKKVMDIDLLNWVKDNLEENYTGTLKKLLMKAFTFGKTALSLAFLYDEYKFALKFLDWVKNNFNEETLEDLVLATDDSRETVLHSAALDPELLRKSKAVKALLKNLEHHPNILKQLVLKSDSSRETVLHIIAKAMNNNKYPWCEYTEKRGEPTVRALLDSVKDDSKTLKDLILATDENGKTALDLAVIEKNNYITNLLTAQYDEIASSLLTDEINDDFNNEQIKVLRVYIRSNEYIKENKQEILTKIQKICASRKNIGYHGGVKPV